LQYAVFIVSVIQVVHKPTSCCIGDSAWCKTVQTHYYEVKPLMTSTETTTILWPLYLGQTGEPVPENSRTH